MAVGYTLVIQKAWGSSSGEDWNNTYEIGTVGPSNVASIMPLVDEIIAFERQVHLTDVFFLRARVGAYAPSVSGYDPYRFYNIPIGLPGLRTRASVQPTDLELVWKLNRVPTTGNAGFVNYRGVLIETETSAVQTGRPKLETGPVMPGAAYIQAMNTTFAPYLGTSANIFIAMIGEYKIGGSETAPIYGPTVIRRVSNFSVFGAGRLKLDKRAYQRPGPDVGDGIEGGGSGGPFNTSYSLNEVEAEEAAAYEFRFNEAEPIAYTP